MPDFIKKAASGMDQDPGFRAGNVIDTDIKKEV
jgi:hypothetical protein